MKVGLHLGEAWESILHRKLAEERDVGFAHWGYGGTVCHPITQVQPFATAAREPVEVLMIRTPSDFLGSAAPATAESQDGRTWVPMPVGVVTTGKYALILRSLRPSDECVDLGAYEVGIGPKAGSPLREYLRGRVDKACAQVSQRPTESAFARVVLRAELVPPYAVILRSQ